MKYTNVKNPQWSSSEKVAIHCIVDFESLGEVPFGANPNDVEEHGREIYNRCIAGDFGPVADYVPASDEGPQPVIENTEPTQGAQTL